MTAKQQAFVNEYIANGENATQAYAKAYRVSESSAGRAGHRLLKNVEVSAAIADARKSTIRDAGITRQNVLDMMLAEAKRANDEGGTAGARVTAIKTLGDWIGMAEQQAQSAPVVINLSGLSDAQLAQLASQSE